MGLISTKESKPIPCCHIIIFIFTQPETLASIFTMFPSPEQHPFKSRSTSATTVSSSPCRRRREESSTKFLNHCSCRTGIIFVAATPDHKSELHLQFIILPEIANHSRSRFAPAVQTITMESSSISRIFILHH